MTRLGAYRYVLVGIPEVMPTRFPLSASQDVSEPARGKWAPASSQQGVTVSKEVKDFHACDEFFRNLGDGYIIARYMHFAEIPSGSYGELQDNLATVDWPKTIRETVGNAGLGPLQVARLRGEAADAVSVRVEERMAVLRKEREELREERRREKAATSRRLERLPAPRWASVRQSWTWS